MEKTQNEPKQKIVEFLQGTFQKRNEIYPTYINLNNPK